MLDDRRRSRPDASRQLVRPTDRDTSMPPLLTAMCEYSDLVRSMTTAPNRAEALKVEGAKASRRGAGQDLRFRIFGPSDESPSVSVVRCGLARALNRGPDFGPLSPSPGSPARAASTDSAADRARRIGRLVQAGDNASDDDPAWITIDQDCSRPRDERAARLRIAFFSGTAMTVPQHLVDYVNETFAAVLVSSEFARKTFRDAGCRRPIKVVPLGIDQIIEAEPAPFAELERVEPERIRLLHVSYTPLVQEGDREIDLLLEAYGAEFTGADPVELIVKTFSGTCDGWPDRVARLQRHLADPPRILVDVRPRSDAEMAWLYSTADAVVIPTCGAGSNLPVVEAMALGRPVVGTAYGSPADVLTEQTGWCLPFDVASAQLPLATESEAWVEPRTDELRRLMRGFCSPEAGGDLTAEARVRSEAARRLVRSVYRWSTTGILIRDYSQAVLEVSEQGRPEVIRLAVVSSRATGCPVAEDTRRLLAGFHADHFACTHICDTRSAADEGVYPLFTTGMQDDLTTCCAVIAARPYDAVLVQHEPSLFDIAAAAPHLAQLQRQAPVFLTLHTTQFLHDLAAVSLAQLAEDLGNLERIIVHTRADQRVLKRIGLVHNVVVIPPGIAGSPDILHGRAPAEWRASLAGQFGRRSGPPIPASRPDLPKRLAAGAFWIGALGYQDPDAGLGALIEAIRKLHEAGRTQVRALLLCAPAEECGEPPPAALESLISAAGLTDAVILIRDVLPIAEPAAWLGALDLLVFPQTRADDSLRAAARVAAGTGCPVLTTASAVFDELSLFAFTATGADGESLARAVSTVIADPAALDSRRKVQLQWMAARDRNRVSALHANIIRGIVAERRIAARAETRPMPLAMPQPPARHSDARPLCPPGIRLPLTGRMRPWRHNIYRLGRGEGASAFGPELARASIAVAWSERDMALMRPVTGAAALHLDRRDRGALDEAVLLIAAEALADIPRVQRSAIFTYARRHGMRTLLERARIPDEDGLTFLADVLVEPNFRSPELPEKVQSLPGIGPQIFTATPGSGPSLLREVATLRGLSMLGFEGHDTPLVAAIRAEAADDVQAGRPGVFRFGEVSGGTPSWIAISGALESARALQAVGPVNNARRCVLFMDDRAVESWRSRQGAAADLVDSASALVFETSRTYQRFFALLSHRPRSVALVRRRACLIEAEVGETPGDLVDRLARVLRLIRPLRPTELYPAFPLLAAPPFAPGEKRLSVCVSTYNRAAWLRVTLPLLARDIAGRDAVEFLVVDNASTDETPDLLEELAPLLGFRWSRNAENVGMLGNLAATVRQSCGDYVWILGDDDLVRPGTVDKLLKALEEAPRIELIYLNYAYTLFNDPAQLADPTGLIEEAKPIAPETPAGFFDTISRFATRNENFFTAIYACIFRRDHAIAAYTQNVDGPPFSSLETCIPTTKYVLEHMMDRPGYWIGSHQIVVNMNVSWMRFALVWHMECLTEAMDLAEAMGADPDELLPYRRRNVGQVIHFMAEEFLRDNGARALLSMTRYIETAKRVDSLIEEADLLFARYDQVTHCQSDRSDELPTAAIRAMYGL